MYHQIWLLTCVLVIQVSSENNSTNSTFTPPRAESMSRLMPSSATGVTVTSNETKHENVAAGSSIEVVTTPDTDTHSLGLSAYTKFNEDMHHFQPSPFLGVISEQAHVKSYPTGVVVGEVFPDTVEKPDPHLGAHKYLYSIEGQQNLHTGHAYHDQVTIQRPAPVTVAYQTNSPSTTTRNRPSLYETQGLKKPVRTSGSTIRPTQRIPEYPFEMPEKTVLMDADNYQNLDNSIAEYKPPALFKDHKPIFEDVIEEKPFRHDSLPPPTVINFHGDRGNMHAPTPHHFSRPKPIQVYPKEDNKWRDALKFFGSLIPIGLLLAAFTPSLIVVNATEAPTDASPVRRASMHSGRVLQDLPASLTSFRLTSCQRRKMCESLTGLKEAEMRTTVYELLKRSGESYEELVELSRKNQCSTVACPTT